MDQEQLIFAEEFGVVFEHLGGARMLGRILGLLSVADPPELTADQIATYLHASRGSVSQATRLLISIGLIQRVSKPGVRADFFRVQKDAWVDSTRSRQREFVGFINVFRRGIEIMRDRSPEARAALEDGLAFMEFMQTRIDDIYREWEHLQQHREPGT